MGGAGTVRWEGNRKTHLGAVKVLDGIENVMLLDSVLARMMEIFLI